MSTNSHSSQSMLLKGKRLCFNAFNTARPVSDDEQTLVSATDKNLTPENSANDVNKAPEQERKRSRVPSRFQDALSEYVTYRHSLTSEKTSEQRNRNTSSSCSRVSSSSPARNEADVRFSRDGAVNVDRQGTNEQNSIYVIRILRSYSSTEQQQQRKEDIIENCCQDISHLRISNHVDKQSEAGNSSTEVNSSGMVVHPAEQNLPCEKQDTCSTTSPQEVNVEKLEPVQTDNKKQKRSVKKLFRLSNKSRRGGRRKRASTKGVRFEILRESAVEGEVENVVNGGQGKSKRKRKAAKRMAKTAGKRLWKGFRVGCKFLWEGLIIYAKPFGTMDFTRAWDEKNAYNNNNNNTSSNNNNRTYTNYNAPRARESVI